MANAFRQSLLRSWFLLAECRGANYNFAGFAVTDGFSTVAVAAFAWRKPLSAFRAEE